MPELTPEIIALLGLASVIAGFIDAIAGGGGLISLPALLSVGLNLDALAHQRQTELEKTIREQTRPRFGPPPDEA